MRFYSAVILTDQAHETFDLQINFREATMDDLPAICILGDDVNAAHHAVEPHRFVTGGDPLRHGDHWDSMMEQSS